MSKPEKRPAVLGAELAALTEITPEALVPRTGDDELASFMLALAVFFSDLKGLLLLQEMLEQAPPDEGVSPASGEWRGLVIQLQKLMYGALRELFDLMKKHDHLTDDRELMRLFKKKPASAKRRWTQLVAVSRGRGDDSGNRFIKVLIKIRNNLAFHYGQSKQLVAGFRRHFYELPSSEDNRFAYASLGSTLGATRFYYADAAVQKAMQILSGEKGTGLDANTRRELRRVLDAVGNLLDAYVKRAFRAG